MVESDISQLSGPLGTGDHHRDVPHGALLEPGPARSASAAHHRRATCRAGASGPAPAALASIAAKRCALQVCRSLCGNLDFFPFRFAAAYRLPGLLFGVTSATAGVWIDDAVLRMRFGLWRVRTPLTNVISAVHTGPFSLLKTMDPAYLSFADRGLTRVTNSERGLCISFAEPVRGLDPLGLLRHPAVTVTVADCDGLATALKH